MQKKYLFIASAVLFAAAAGVCSFKVCAEKNTGIAARINGEVISVEEVRTAYLNNPSIAQKVTFEDFYDKAMATYVNTKLLYQAATKAKIQDTPEYKELYKAMQEELAVKLYLNKIIEEKTTETALKDLYEKYVQSFKSTKEINAKHILTDSEAKAKEAISKLKKGEKFEEVAKQYTKDSAVDLGYFSKDVMVPEFSEVAFALKKGEYTKKPVKTQFGYHVILVEDIRDSKPASMEQLLPQLKDALAQKFVMETIDELHNNGNIEQFDLNGQKVSNPKPAE